MKLGLKIFQDFDGYYAEQDDDNEISRVIKVGRDREQATRNALKRFHGTPDYLTGDGVDETVAKEFNIPVRD